MNLRTYIISILIAFFLLYSTHSAAKNLPLPLDSAQKTFFVHPDGNDQSVNTLKSPFASIQRAMGIAQAGDTILLLKGVYLQDIISVRDGLPNKPIRIVGMPGVVVKGAGKTSIFDIQHSYIELSHFVIDGLFSSRALVTNFRKKLVYIKGQKDKGITGVKLLYMEIKNARDECIRVKYQAQNNEVAYSHISYCGVEDYRFNDGTKSHNGEAVYIGTAPEQIEAGKNPTLDVDHSNQNWIHHNTLKPYGSECVDIKEGSNLNVIEHNVCMYEQDLNVGGISIRGNDNTVRHNHVTANLGAGIRLGGDTVNDGINNHVYDNYLEDNLNSGLKIMREPQGKICDNTIITIEDQKQIRVSANMDKNLYIGKCINKK